MNYTTLRDIGIIKCQIKNKIKLKGDVKMKIKNKIIIYLVLVYVIQLFCFAESGFSWYFKPSNENRQPEIIPEASGFLNKYNVISIGNDQEKKIYLTFDAGYENGNVEKILNVLKEKNVPGAFFILPQLAKTNPELVQRMKDEGHLVCNHTKSHKDMSKVKDINEFSAELINAENMISEYSGVQMDKFYRPPEGRFSEQNLQFADSLGYTTVFWSLAYADWDNNKQMNQEKALKLLCQRTHPGCVALLHPTSSTNAAIIGNYIDIMKDNGYTFGSLTELKKTSGEVVK